MNLHQRACEPCGANASAVSADQYEELLSQLPGWSIHLPGGVPTLAKTYPFERYTQCLAFAQAVGELAEKHDHHPEITIAWGKVTLLWWTHTLKGLHMNDFILAAASDDLASKT